MKLDSISCDLCSLCSSPHTIPPFPSQEELILGLLVQDVASLVSGGVSVPKVSLSALSSILQAHLETSASSNVHTSIPPADTAFRHRAAPLPPRKPKPGISSQAESNGILPVRQAPPDLLVGRVDARLRLAIPFEWKDHLPSSAEQGEDHRAEPGELCLPVCRDGELCPEAGDWDSGSGEAVCCFYLRCLFVCPPALLFAP
jgi:hypothetical protein